MDNKIGASKALPPLPQVAYVRHVRSNPHPAIARLADLLRTAALELGP
jgi:hypothetical protein